MTLIPPDRGMETKLGDVDKNLDQVTGKRATNLELMAVAQVQATGALVHAVRELTAEFRKLARREDADA